MNPGLLVKLRAAGPWRIGPDSGARNRVEPLLHSDGLYSAVTQAMSRLGFLDLWLGATARTAEPAVCFSSCFPLSGDTLFVTPPRTVWPPSAATLASGRVRWKSARFVPFEIVHEILAGKSMNEDRWTLDGASGCLIPTGKQGPFRTGLRWSAAIDRLSGAAERHATACLEFLPGAGLWTVASFTSSFARDAWQERVQAAFRLLADSGFGGERSRGWGRAEAPEFKAGALPELLMGAPRPKAVPQPAAEVEAPGAASVPGPAGDMVSGVSASAPDVIPPIQEPPQEEPPVTEPPSEPEPPQPDPEPQPNPEPEPTPEPVLTTAAEPVREPTETAAEEPTPEAIETAPEPASGEEAIDENDSASNPDDPTIEPAEPRAQWLLSLFSPAPADAVDWSRGNYDLIDRGGRIESDAGSGGLKKQVRMIVEGSVLYSASPLRGAAPDVAPDGFAHPVFRAGFALAIPLPEAS